MNHKQFGMGLFVALFAIISIGWIHGTVQPAAVVYVWDQLTLAQRTDVANRTATLDVGAKIDASIALCPSTACQLVFAPGKYRDDACAHTISVPTEVIGGGSPSYGAPGNSANNLLGGTVIACGSASAKLFTVTAAKAKFQSIGLYNTNATATSGSSAIYVNSTNQDQRVDFDDLYVDGFYDSLDISVSQSWSGSNSFVVNSTHWGVRIRNTANADAGDWALKTTKIYPKSGAAACIRYESSGGGTIDGIRCLPNSGTIIDGISMDVTGNVSQELMVTNTKIDHVTNIPINVAQGWNYIQITNSFLKTDGVDVPSIAMTSSAFALLSNNISIGSSSTVAPVVFTNYNRTTLGFNELNGYTLAVPYGSFGMNNQMVSTVPVTVANLPNANSVLPGVKAIVSDANSTTFHATVAGGGSNTIVVVSDGTNWKIGG